MYVGDGCMKCVVYIRGVDTILELGGLSYIRGGKKNVCAQTFDHTHQYVNTPTYRI